MDKISAILNIIGLALLFVIIMVKPQTTMVIILLVIAGICILAATVRTIANIFRGRKR